MTATFVTGRERADLAKQVVAGTAKLAPRGTVLSVEASPLNDQ